MKRCHRCGSVPFFGRYLEWTPDGTVLGSDRSRTRVVFLEVGEVDNLLSGISGRIGFPVDRIACRGEKEIGRRFISTLIPELFTRVPRTRLTRPPAFQRWVGRYIISPYIAQMGMGRVAMDSYRAGRWMTFRLFNPYSAPLLVGDGMGIIEYLERVGLEAEWREGREGVTYVEVRKAGDAPVFDERLSFEKQAFIRGAARLERCSSCGVPLEITRNLTWNLDAGIMKNRSTGAREVVLPGASFSAVMRELERELGEEFPVLLEELERDFARESSARGGHLRRGAAFLEVLSGFVWRGIGNPVSVEEDGGGITVTVENPFHSSLVAGRVIGLHEAWTEAPAEASWVEESHGRLKVNLRKT